MTSGLSPRLVNTSHSRLEKYLRVPVNFKTDSRRPPHHIRPVPSGCGDRSSQPSLPPLPTDLPQADKGPPRSMDPIHGHLLVCQRAEQLGVQLQNLSSSPHHPPIRWQHYDYDCWSLLGWKEVLPGSDGGCFSSYGWCCGGCYGRCSGTSK